MNDRKEPQVKQITRREMLLALAVGSATAACVRLRDEAGPSRRELILCGAEEVFILALGPGSNPAAEKVWSWRATDSAEIPESLRRAFRSTDDCKPLEDGRKILISSSSGAVAAVERETKRALFCASVINAHSIEALPGGRVAAAASVSDSPEGNRLILFDMASKREIASDRLVSAHGVVWDEKRGLLWALGNDELRAYRVAESQGGKEPLKVELQVKLPESGGHDLSPIPGTPLLFISTNTHCWLFHRDTRTIAPHDLLADTPRVKSYSVHPVTGRVAYVQAEGSDWWAERVHFLRPEGVLHLPGQRLYKARWNAGV